MAITVTIGNRPQTVRTQTNSNSWRQCHPMHYALSAPQTCLNASNLVNVPIQPSVTFSSISTPRPQLDPNSFKSRNGLGIIHVNIRSLIQKLDYVNSLILQSDPDILVLSESWLKKSIADSDVALLGYNLFRVDRVGRGGGVIVYVKTGLSVSVLDSISLPKKLEFIALKIQLGPSSVVVIGVYRPPAAGIDSVATLANLIARFTEDELVVVGDFNLNWLNSNSDHLKEVCGNLSLTQLITEPTRPNLKDCSKSTLIDLVFSNRTDKIVATGVFDLGDSDHCPIACIRSAKMEKTSSHTVMKRNLKCLNEQAFLNDCMLSNINGSLESTDAQECLDLFVNTFISLVDKHAPYKRLRIKDRIAPWFSHELSTLQNDRNKAWSRARRSDDPQHWLAFRQLRNRCTSAMRKAKSDYYLDLITSSFGNPAQFWKAVNLKKGKTSNSLPAHISVNDCIISGQNEICLAFNKHFADAGHLFDRECLGPHPVDVNINFDVDAVSECVSPVDHTPKFSFRPFSQFEVFEALQSLNPKTSTGEDNLDSFFLKLSAPVITEQLTHIFNLSIITGRVPSVWKSAQVIPLHKGGAKDELNNYRPISKLPCLAKVLESLVNTQLKSYLSKFSILSPHQSGFRANHSTVSAISLVTNDIISALDNKKHCAALFVDLSKAFDTVDHNLLLERLATIGLDRNACDWFRDYLTGRRQCVKSGHAKSEFLSITKGVPQGSILGPVLFTIYINDIVSSLNGCQAHLYADDTVVYCIADSVQLATENLQLSFIALQEALTKLRLVLNASKTKCMLFSRARKTELNKLHISTINGTNIERVSEYKYLGVWLDEKFTFKFHVDNLAAKLRQKIGFLYRNRSNFPLVSRKKVVEAVFLSVLDYGDVIYRHAAASTLKPLDSVYHSALRFITGDKYDTHHCVLYEKVGWPSLVERRNKHWYLFVFKALIGKQPPYIQSLLEYNISSYGTRSSDWLVLKIPPVYTNLGKSAFYYDAPSSWNALQQSLKIEILPSIAEFGTLITNHCKTTCMCFF